MTPVREPTRWGPVAVGVAVGALLLFSGTREWAWMVLPQNGFTARALDLPTLPLGAAALAAGNTLGVARGAWRMVVAAGTVCIGLGIVATCIGFVHDTETPVYAATMADNASYVLVAYEVGETPWPYVVGGAGVLLAATGAAAAVAATRERRARVVG